MEALGNLAGGIAHDFNNVLQAVIGGLGYIQTRANDAQVVARFARMCLDAATRGSAITNRLLAFSRSGALKPQPVPPAHLLENMREILIPTLGVEIAVRIDADPNLPPLIADRSQLETVLVNLSINARDAMPDGGTLIFSATRDGGPDADQSDSSGYIRLDVADTGTGMDEATLARASEPFFTTKPMGKGTGLGLAMARGFAEQSHGAFRIRSVLGEGTTITLWLPEAVEESPPQREADRLSSQVVDDDAHVLLVDDDALVRMAMAAELRERGFDITEASDGLTALAWLEAGNRPDLLITDLAMPGMNGYVLIEQVRERLPDLPIILLTGNADPGIGLTATSGPSAEVRVLRKPLPGGDLAAQAAELLAVRHERV
jgi:CheY-like chemotaxis protein